MESNIIFPKNLQKGDKIAIISPAGFVVEPALDKTMALIQSKGYEPVLGKFVYGKNVFGYNYSGTEKERKKDLQWALNDEEISAVWASRGGYGCAHLIQNLKLSGFKNSPKWYIGYSDNTVVQSFLLKQGFASIHGQTIKTASFGVSEDSYEGIFDIFKGKRPKYLVENSVFNRKGEAEGELIGGNLSLIYSLMGTKFGFDFKDKILFIEEIGENFYSLDRMLMNMELAGVFRKIKGLVVGGMINMENEKDNPKYEESFDDFAYEIIQNRIKKYDFPTLFGFPNGHIFENKPLIIGAYAKLSVSNRGKLSF